MPGADISIEKVALITGANQGIGFEIGRQLGRLGVTVLIGARNKQRCREAVDALRGEGIDAREIILDVTKQGTIDAAAGEVDREFGRLDILINNAAILIDRELPSQCPIETIRRTFDTNFFGVFSVTKSFLPLIREAEAGRIVNMTSGLASLTRTGDPASAFANYLAYVASKVALNAMTLAFAKELWNTPIKVNAVSPGYTATAMNNYAGHKTTEDAAVVPVRLATLPQGGPTGGFFDEDGPVPW